MARRVGAAKESVGQVGSRLGDMLAPNRRFSYRKRFKRAGRFIPTGEEEDQAAHSTLQPFGASPTRRAYKGIVETQHDSKN